MKPIKLSPPVVPKKLSRRVQRKIKLDKWSREQDVKINNAKFLEAHLSFDVIGKVTYAALNMKIHREHPETLGNIPLNVKEEWFKRIKQQANVKWLPEEKKWVKK